MNEAAVERNYLGTLGSRSAMGKLGGVYAGSRVLGLVRELAVAYALGTTAAADRVAGALIIASAAGYVLGEAVFAGSVARIAASESSLERSRRYGESFRVALRLGVLTVAAYAILGSLATTALLGAWGGGIEETTTLALLLAPSVGAYVVSSCINGWLTVERRFVLLNAAQTLYSVGAIALLIVAWAADTGLKGEAVAAGWSLGTLAALGLLFILARPPGAHGSHHSVALLRLGAPLAIGAALLVGQSVTDRAIAARLDTGDVAALSYADRLFLLPIGFVLAVVGPIVLGSLTVAAASSSGARVQDSIVDHLALVARVAVPVSLAVAALTPAAVPLLFEYGAFTSSSTDRTVDALNGFAAGVAAIAMVLVLVRVLQATGHRRLLIQLTAWAALANLSLAIAGGAALGLGGVTLATSLVGALTVAFGIERLGGEFGSRWRSTAQRRATLPVLSCTAALAALLIVERLGGLSQGVRVATIGTAAVVTGFVLLAGWGSAPRSDP